MKNIFEVSRKVHEAITSKKPIVALESTLISHGLPYPENIQVANESIKAVEDNGAVAATIGIIKGKVKIGKIKFANGRRGGSKLSSNCKLGSE